MLPDTIQSEKNKDMSAFTEWVHSDKHLSALPPSKRNDLLLYVSGLLSIVAELRHRLYRETGR